MARLPAAGRCYRQPKVLAPKSQAAFILLTAFIGLAGCTQAPYPPGPGFTAGNPWGAGPDTATITSLHAQVAELQRRNELLDKDNRQLQTQLAQSEQQTQVYRQESQLVRSQLADTAQRLEELRIAAGRTQQQFQGLQASTQFRGGATLEANTNVRQIAEALKSTGIPVLYEGDTARILIPSDQLFQPGTGQLLPQAGTIISPLASQIVRIAPRQRLGVECFSDDAPIYGGQYSNAHQLTSAQALAIFELLATRGGIARDTMSTVGYGDTRPRQSNESAAGRAANRRVEIVIYPDTL